MNGAVTKAGVSLRIEDLSPKLAMELGAGLSDVDTIKKRYGLSDQQWEQLRVNPTFRQMVKDAMETYAGDLNADKRIQAKAAMAAEESLLEMFRLVRDESIPPSSRIDAHKHLSRLAKIDKPEDAPSGNGFTLNIKFSGGPQEVKVGGAVIDAEKS
jgi:hypothetical protein